MSNNDQDDSYYQRLFRKEPFLISGREFSAREILEKLTPLVEEQRINRLQDVISKRTFEVAPVLENIYDRGNVSAVLRSAEAFGFIDFNIIEKEGALFKNSNRISKGTEKWMDIQKHGSTKECVQKLREKGFKIYCTHLESSLPIDELDFCTQPTAVVFGNEKDGVSDEMLELADGNFILPMHGFAQSFNISVAGALTFYHIHQQRLRHGHSGSLSTNEQRILMANYILRSANAAEKVLLRQE